MDVLRKELEGIYSGQQLDKENLETAVLNEAKGKVESAALVSDGIRVVTDASADTSYVYGGALARLLGLNDEGGRYAALFDSSDEDEIYAAIHPEDLVDKRMLEYEFFKFITACTVRDRQRYAATCRIRIKAVDGHYINVSNSTRILQTSPAGNMWLILCCYDLATDIDHGNGISPAIVDLWTGDIQILSFGDKRSQILSSRERQVLMLIKDGYPSKQIAARLGITLNTVNRHRQNILQKLSVSNSAEAVKAAIEMRLLWL